ncbi:hypothetical protein BURKHO8Y_480082 [Burkholderia sp. 8Y]|nr:hypothetical protein BURKHO8Y_480082 [Burkholderia sp. 8Y]
MPASAFPKRNKSAIGGVRPGLADLKPPAFRRSVCLYASPERRTLNVYELRIESEGPLRRFQPVSGAQLRLQAGNLQGLPGAHLPPHRR